MGLLDLGTTNLVNGSSSTCQSWPQLGHPSTPFIIVVFTTILINYISLFLKILINILLKYKAVILLNWHNFFCYVSYP